MYLGIQFILLGIVIYKLSAMGLLPVSAADYVDMVPPFEVSHHSRRRSRSSLGHDTIPDLYFTMVRFKNMTVFYPEDLNLYFSQTKHLFDSNVSGILISDYYLYLTFRAFK